MALFNDYPYTDFHEINLDWIIRKMKELEAELDGILEEAVKQATENAEAYVDSKLADILSQFNGLKTLVNNLEGDVSDLQNEMDVFEALINVKVESIRTEMLNLNAATNTRMEIMIQQNNDYILSQLETFLSQIKVINFFTGEKVSIQDMFNYLAMLHITDGITYTVMAARGKTYTELAALNITYTDLVEHGNTLYV